MHKKLSKAYALKEQVEKAFPEKISSFRLSLKHADFALALTKKIADPSVVSVGDESDINDLISRLKALISYETQKTQAQVLE